MPFGRSAYLSGDLVRAAGWLELGGDVATHYGSDNSEREVDEEEYGDHQLQGERAERESGERLKRGRGGGSSVTCSGYRQDMMTKKENS